MKALARAGEAATTRAASPRTTFARRAPPAPRLARNTVATGTERSTNTARRRAARQRLDPERTATCEEIERLHPVEIAETREERLTHSVGGRPHGGRRWHPDASPSQLASRHAQCISSP